MENKLKEDEKSLRQQLDRLVEEELTGSSEEMPREIQFQPLMLESLPGQNLLGVVTVDGVLPSHLSLGLLSQLADLRDGASLRLEVAATLPGLGDSWQRKIVVTAVVQGEDGTERKIRVQRKREDGKVLLRFEAGLGVHKVSVWLYGQHVLSSPFIIPVQSEPEKILAEVGLCFLGQTQADTASQRKPPEDVQVESGDNNDRATEGTESGNQLSSSASSSTASSSCEESPGQDLTG